MQRIDSINARPDENGIGKAGFNDNADIPGQDATYLTPTWCNTIQEEIAGLIENFGLNLDPSDRSQLIKVLGLHSKILMQTIYHVGSKHMTDKSDWNPAIDLKSFFGYETSWMLWPHVPVGVNAASPIGTITPISSAVGTALLGSSTRIWQRLPDGASAPTYNLTASSNAINEGEQVTFTLSTTGLPVGTLVDWVITGIQSNDITPAMLAGQFTIGSNGTASHTVTAVADQKTEGNETLKFALTYIPNKSTDVLIIDTSKYPEGVQTFYEGAHTIEVLPHQVITLDMFGAGAGGSGSNYSPSASPDGQNGGDVVLSYLTNTFKAAGGKKGKGGVWANGSSFSNGEPGKGGINEATADSSFEILINQNGNDATLSNRYSRQLGGVAINSDIGAVNGGGNGAWGIGDERWAFGGGGGGGGRLKVRYTNTTDAPVILNLEVGAKGLGWSSGGNSGDDGGIGFAIVTFA